MDEMGNSYVQSPQLGILLHLNRGLDTNPGIANQISPLTP